MGVEGIRPSIEDAVYEKTVIRERTGSEASSQGPRHRQIDRQCYCLD